MADDLIIRVALDASGVTAGVAQANTGLSQLDSQLAHITVSGSDVTVALRNAAAAAGYNATAAADLRAQLDAAATAEKALADAAKANSAADAAAAKKAEADAIRDAAAAMKEQADALANTKYYSENFEKAAESADKLNFATAGALREFIVLGHELISGNISRFFTSLPVLAERVGGLHTIVEKFTAGWIAAGAAGLAALAAIGYAAYQAAESVLAARDATNRLAEAGVSGPTSQAQSQRLVNVGADEFHESRTVIRGVIDELDKLPASALRSREAFFRLAEAIHGFHPEENIKNIVKELASAGRTPEGLAKAITERFGDQLFGDESLERHVRRLKEAGEAEKAYADALRIANEVASPGAAARRSNTNLQNAILGQTDHQGIFTSFPNPFQGFGGVLNPFQELPEPRVPIAQRPRQVPEVPEIVRGQEVAERQTGQDEKRKDLQADLNKLLEAEAALRSQIAEITAAGQTTPRSENLTRELEQNLSAQANIAAETSRIHTAAESKAHGETMARLAGDLAAQHNNATEVIAVRAAMYDEVLRYEAEAISKAKGIPITDAAVEAANIKEALDAENQYTTAVRSLREQEFKVWIDQMREAEAQAGHSGAQRIAIEEQVNRAIHAAAAEPIPLANAQQVEAGDKHIAEVKRQESERALETVIRNLDEELRAAQHNADARIAIEQRKADAIRSFITSPLIAQGRTPEAANAVAAEDPRLIDAINRGKDTTRAAEREKLDISIATERARVDETERGSQARLQVEKDYLAKLQEIKAKEGDASIVGEREIAEQKIRLANTEREVRDRAYRDFAAAEKQKVVEAKGDADAILAIYRDWAAQAATIYQQRPSVVIGVETEGIKAGQQADKDRFQNAESNVRLYEAISRQEIAIDKAKHDIAVAQHRESKSQALAAEQQYTEQVLAQIIERVKAEELVNAKLPDDRIKALQDLARAEGEYTAKVIEDQAKITQAVEAENKKQVETIKQGFDQIGSSVEGAFKGIISGSISSTDKVVRQQHVAANGVVFFTNTVQHQSALAAAGMKVLDATGSAIVDTFLKLGSQAAAKSLAPVFGQQFSEGEVPSLSGLLAKAAGGLFGLGNKTPKTDSLDKLIPIQTEQQKTLAEIRDLLAQKGVTGVGGGATAPGGKTTGLTTPSQTAAEYSVGSAPIPGSGDVQGQMYQWLIGHGYSPTAASAVIGNAAAESGLHPDIISKDGAGSFGLFQETGPRRRGLEDYAASTGRAPTDLNVQLEYMDKELTEINPAFKQATDSASNLAKQFEKEFERPKSLADAPRRAGYAEQVYASQSGTGMTATASTISKTEGGVTTTPSTPTRLGKELYTGESDAQIAKTQEAEYQRAQANVAPQAPDGGTTGFAGVAGLPGSPSGPTPVPVTVVSSAPAGGTTGYAGVAGPPDSPSGPASTQVPIAATVEQNTAAVTQLSTSTQSLSTAVTNQQASVQTDASNTQTNTTSIQNQTSAAQVDADATKAASTALTDNTAALKALTDKLGQTSIGSVAAAPSTGGGLAASAPTTGTPLSRGASASADDAAAKEATGGVLSAGSAIGSLIGGPVGVVTSTISKLVGAFNTVTSGVTKATDGLSKIATGASSASSSVSTLSTAASTAGSAQTALTTVTQAGQTIKTAETTATQISTTATIADQTATQTMATDALAAGADFRLAGAQATAGAGGTSGGGLGSIPIIGPLIKGVSSLFGGGGGAAAGLGAADAAASGAADAAAGGFAADAADLALLALSGGGMIPSAAGGMTVNDGKGGTLAIVHPQEMVLPASISAGIQHMISSLPSAAGGMVVSGGPPQSVAPLGWSVPGTVGSPSTPSFVSPATPPHVTFPNVISPSSGGSKMMPLLALGGAGLLAGVPLISKLFGSKEEDGAWSSSDNADWSSSDGAWAGESDFSSFSLMRGGVIPSAAGGMRVDDGKGGTLAIVHPNEMVLPADLSHGIQNIVSKGGLSGHGIPSADEGMVVPGDALGTAPTGNAGSSSNAFQQGTATLQISAGTLGTAGTSLITASQQLSAVAKSGGSGGSGGGGALGLVGKIAGTIVGGLVGGPIGATVGGTLGGAIGGSFDVGTDRVPYTGLALIHKDEMIIPAERAGRIRAGGGSSGGSVFDARGGTDKRPSDLMFPNYADDLRGAVRDGMRAQENTPQGDTTYHNLRSAVRDGMRLHVNDQGGAPSGNVNTSLSYAPTVSSSSSLTIQEMMAGESQGMTDWVSAMARGEAVPLPGGSSVGRFLGHFAKGTDRVRETGLAVIHADEMIVPAAHAEKLRSMMGGGGIDSLVGLESRLPHFELGAWEISRDQAGFLHKGESVMPSSSADLLRDLLTGGGTTNNGGDVNLHYAPTVNAPAASDLESLLNRQGQTMLGWINAQMRSGALRPPPG